MNTHGQTICLTMIVKDEAKVILRCLKSVKDIVDYYYISDTGSTDGTPEIIEQYLKENNLKGEVGHHEWVNFGTNRTLALDACRDKCDYQLTLDADEVFVNSTNPDEPAKITEYLDRVIYHVPCRMGGMTYKRNQLWKSAAGVYWGGVCHEFIAVKPGLPTTYGMISSITNTPIQDGARSQDPNKFAKDAVLFEEYLKKDPKCARSWFYLGQSYADSGQAEKGIQPMLNAAKYTGWDEERFMAYYRAGMYAKNSRNDESFIPYLIKAYETRPQRAEALYLLIRYGRETDRWKFSELFCEKALDIKLPENDVLFVENYIYDWGLLDEISIAYYWLGRYKESYDICLRLLDSGKVPYHQVSRVKDNANHAKEKLGIS